MNHTERQKITVLKDGTEKDKKHGLEDFKNILPRREEAEKPGIAGRREPGQQGEH